VKKKKMNTKNVILGMAIAVVVLVAAVGSASANGMCVVDDPNAPDNAYGCGDLVNYSCTLNGTMSCPSTHGLIVNNDSITINGAGCARYQTIDGVNNGNCVDIPNLGYVLRAGIYNPGHKDVTIKNLRIRRFCDGIRIAGTFPDKFENNTIYNCIVCDNGNNTVKWLVPPPAGIKATTDGIKLQTDVDNSTITKCRIYNNIGANQTPPCESGGMGIYLKLNCTYNSITDNTIYGNKGAGILAKAKCRNNYIANNDIYQNGEESYTGPTGGIVLRCKKSDNWLIEENNIQDNYGPGIWIGGSGNTVKNNTVEGSKNASGDIKTGYGIAICRQPEGGKNNRLEDNKVCFNEGKDVFVLATGYNNTGDENCCDTTKNYDDDGTAGCTYCCTKDLIITDIWLGRDWRCISRKDIELEQKEIAEFIREADVKNVEQEEFIDYIKERDVGQEDLIDYIKERDVEQEAMTKELAAEKCIRGRRVHYRIMNRGCQEWAGWSVSNLTVDGVSPWPPWLGWDLVRPLAPKQSRHEWFWLYRLPGGSHDVKVCADFPNWISECNETNNCLTKTLGGPTLVTPIPIPPRER
jgi:parallel beta-helix repeat protein